jgi:hypothetical protein
VTDGGATASCRRRHFIKQTTRAKKVTPSIKAAETIIAVWMFPATSGCLAMLSTAQDPILPMPYPAPMITKPAPKAAPWRIEKLAPASLPVSCAKAGTANVINTMTHNVVIFNILITVSISLQKVVIGAASQSRLVLMDRHADEQYR